MSRVLTTLLTIWGLAAMLGAQAPESAPGQSARKSQSETRPAGLVNLNTATAAELADLPGIGAKTAARIVDYRQKKGPFKKPEELMNVQGIGEKTFLRMKPRLSVGGKAEGPSTD